MEKEETKTKGNNGMNGRNHAAYVSHPCQDEGLPACSWMEQARFGSMRSPTPRLREPSTTRWNDGFLRVERKPSSMESNVFKECTLASLQPRLLRFPSMFHINSSTKQCKVGPRASQPLVSSCASPTCALHRRATSSSCFDDHASCASDS